MEILRLRNYLAPSLLLADPSRTGQSELLSLTNDLRADIVVAGLPDAGEPLCDGLIAAAGPKVIVVADSASPANQPSLPACAEEALGTDTHSRDLHPHCRCGENRRPPIRLAPDHHGRATVRRRNREIRTRAAGRVLRTGRDSYHLGSHLDIRQLKMVMTLGAGGDEFGAPPGRKMGSVSGSVGDTWRDLVLYVGRRYCRLKLKELGEIAGLGDYSTNALAIKRFQKRLERQGSNEQDELNKLCEMSNVEM